MGNARLNIWIRDTNCNLVRRRGHLHVLNCHGTEVIPSLWFNDGHAEVQVPPGCYIVVAGVVQGNIYTDMTMVVAKCDESVCVNLVLTSFIMPRAVQAVPREPIAYNCPRALAVPLIVNAFEKKINVKEVKGALEVMSRAADMEVKELMQTIKDEAELLQKNIKEMAPEEREFVEKLMAALKELR